MTPRLIAAALIERCEGCELVPYRDIRKLWTIGFGHLLSMNPHIPRPDIRLTQQQADNLLVNDLSAAERVVRALVKVRLTANQEAALVSLAFNLMWHLRGSVLVARLNRGDLAGAADQFPRWRYAGGVPSRGLLNRRIKERALFLAA